MYLRHSYDEVAEIVGGEVAATLDRSAYYGISWYGKKRHTHHREVRIKDAKKTYPRIKKSVDVPREEWISVPVPDPGIPREWVLAARDAIKDNEKISNCGRRFWELTGGVFRCAACGSAMATNFITPRKTGYYRCGRRYRVGEYACSQGKNIRAEETETAVWDFVLGILKDPERLPRGIDEMLDRERALTSRSPAMTRRAGSKSSQNSWPKKNDYLTSTWKVSWRSAATSHAFHKSSNPEGPSRMSSSASGITLLT